MVFIFVLIALLIYIFTIGITVRFSINTRTKCVFAVIDVLGGIAAFKFRLFETDNKFFYQINGFNIRRLKLDISTDKPKKLKLPPFPRLVITQAYLSGRISDEDDAFASNMSCFAFNSLVKGLLLSLDQKILFKDLSVLTYPSYDGDALKFNAEILLKSAVFKIILYVLRTIIKNTGRIAGKIRNGKSN